MSETSNSLNVLTGRDASRMRRNQLVSGKAGMPPARERVRVGPNGRKATVSADTLPSETVSVSESTSNVAANAAQSTQPILTGREASRARRMGLIQGKQGITQVSSASEPTMDNASTDDIPAASDMANKGRQVAKALRNARARKGQGSGTMKSRPSGRLPRNVEAIQCPPKVAESKSYAGQKVTGVRIGQKENVTGTERGAVVQVTGDQYIGRETGFDPREGGIKVGASKTAAGLVVTGSQVRNKVNITGDESNPALRITGEADQELGDDLLQRNEQGGYSQMQFQRQNDPHGRTVFGTNLGRSIKSIGSRNRDTEYKKEATMGGHAITGTAVGRSALTTGDESGACRDVTGDQYLMPAQSQPLCAAHQHDCDDDCACKSTTVTGDSNTPEATTWRGQYITGVDVEHNSKVTGDEQGLCDVITGTPYVGPDQYQAYCSAENEGRAQRRILSESANVISGDALSSADHVTGTQRGSERGITGTPYYKADPEGNGSMSAMDRVRNISNRFSVHSPQREYQERAGLEAAHAPSAASRITGAFSGGSGKITGNQEFHFNPRSNVASTVGNTHVTGEGRVEGKTVTGSAWTSQDNVTGTEGHIAAERNPSQRYGDSHAWAGARKFKDKKDPYVEPTHHVTGMVGWSPKASVPITVSGGAQG